MRGAAHELTTVAEVVRRRADGLTIAAIASELSLPPTTVWNWCAGRVPRQPAVPRHGPDVCPLRGRDPSAYALLLGFYLGDGCVARQRNGVDRLEVVQDAQYPASVNEIRAAMEAVFPNRAGVRDVAGAKVVSIYSTHILCLFPQHGVGRKHERPIVLEAWQQAIVEEHTERFVRGLFHSDGARVVNRVVRKGKAYEYSRYMFSNRSADIHALLQAALDRLGVEWRMNNAWSLSVATRESVARLDAFVGPKS